MDETDMSILRELTENPQVPILRIAERIGVSPRTVQKKYQKMKDDGIIRRSSIIIDLSKIGYQGKAYLHITNTPGQDKELTVNALKKIPDIFLITEIIGEFDVLAIAAVKNYKSVINMVNTVKRIPSVDQVDATFVADTTFPGGKEFNDLFSTERSES